MKDDPLMACYGLIGFDEAQNCVPGVGAVRPQDVKVQLPEYAKSSIGKPGGPSQKPTATLNIDGRWLRAFLVPYTVASHGLTAESVGTRIEILDLANRSTVASIDVPNAKMDAILADTKNGLFVAALTDYRQLFDGAGYRSKNVDVTMAGIDPLAGKALWQSNDTLTSNPAAVIDRGVLPTYGVPYRECDGATQARTVQVLDTKTGNPNWSKHVTELPGRKDGKQCTTDIVYADPRLPFVQVVREGATYFGSAPTDNYNIVTHLDVNTGEVFTAIPPQRFTFSQSVASVQYHFDPSGPLTMIQEPSRDWLVVDRESGTIVNRIPEATLSKVKASVQGIFDSKIYLKNTTVFAIDARTGAELGVVKSRPVRTVNGWILHEDGAFTKG